MYSSIGTSDLNLPKDPSENFYGRISSWAAATFLFFSMLGMKRQWKFFSSQKKTCKYQYFCSYNTFQTFVW